MVIFEPAKIDSDGELGLVSAGLHKVLGEAEGCGSEQGTPMSKTDSPQLMAMKELWRREDNWCVHDSVSVVSSKVRTFSWVCLTMRRAFGIRGLYRHRNAVAGATQLPVDSADVQRRARQRVVGLMQRITFEEFAPVLLGTANLPSGGDRQPEELGVTADFVAVTDAAWYVSPASA